MSSGLREEGKARRERAVPAVSVVMSVYNGKRYLTEAVESILNQTFRDFEFIIIDDGSADGSSELLEKYAAQDERIRLVSRENRGLTVSLNEGIAMARAPLIARMDADDISLPQRLEVQVEYMQVHPEVVCIGSYNELIDEKSRVIGLRDYTPTGDAAVQQALLSGNNVLPHSAVMLRTAAVRQVGGYDETFLSTQDLDLWLRLGEVGRIGMVPQLLVQYRDHGEAISSKRETEQLANKRRACEAAAKRRGVASLCEDRPYRAITRTDRYAAYGTRWWFAYSTRRWRTAVVYAVKRLLVNPVSPRNWWLVLKTVLTAFGAMVSHGQMPKEHWR